MEFINREVKLCLGCMEYHMVYAVLEHGVQAEYCYNTDTLLIDPDEYM